MIQANFDILMQKKLQKNYDVGLDNKQIYLEILKQTKYLAQTIREYETQIMSNLKQLEYMKHNCKDIL